MEENRTKSIQLKKVVLIGPECTGKSTLASLLAKYYNTVWVPEYARDYINRLDRSYEEKDLLPIARGQLESEENLAKEANQILICDTDLTVIKIWSEHKYGACYDEILDAYHQQSCDLYLLMGIDVPWCDDPQRENPHLRSYFYDVFKNELKQKGANFVEISGGHFERQKQAVEIIDELILSN